MIQTIHAVFRLSQAASSAFENAADTILNSMGAVGGKRGKPPKPGGVPTEKSDWAHVRSNAFSVCSCTRLFLMYLAFETVFVFGRFRSMWVYLYVQSQGDIEKARISADQMTKAWKKYGPSIDDSLKEGESNKFPVYKIFICICLYIYIYLYLGKRTKRQTICCIATSALV